MVARGWGGACCPPSCPHHGTGPGPHPRRVTMKVTPTDVERHFIAHINSMEPPARQLRSNARKRKYQPALACLQRLIVLVVRLVLPTQYRALQWEGVNQEQRINPRKN